MLRRIRDAQGICLVRLLLSVLSLRHASYAGLHCVTEIFEYLLNAMLFHVLCIYIQSQYHISPSPVVYKLRRCCPLAVGLGHRLLCHASDPRLQTLPIPSSNAQDEEHSQVKSSAFCNQENLMWLKVHPPPASVYNDADTNYGHT